MWNRSGQWRPSKFVFIVLHFNFHENEQVSKPHTPQNIFVSIIMEINIRENWKAMKNVKSRDTDNI
jgi:hypothetical protein